MTADLNLFENAEKSDSAKAVEENNRIKIPAKKVCPRITRLGSASGWQTRIDANGFSSDDLIVPSLSFGLLSPTSGFVLVFVLRARLAERKKLCKLAEPASRPNDEFTRREAVGVEQLVIPYRGNCFCSLSTRV
jgi:hypothetical protein